MINPTRIDDPSHRFAVRHLAGLLFLALQILSIAYARIAPERFFCWAPYDERTSYRIDVQVEGKRLSDDEVAARYRYYPNGWEARSIHNIFSMVRQYETTYGKSDGARVTIPYETNGHPQRIWKWPES